MSWSEIINFFSIATSLTSFYLHQLQERLAPTITKQSIDKYTLTQVILCQILISYQSSFDRSIDHNSQINTKIYHNLPDSVSNPPNSNTQKHLKPSSLTQIPIILLELFPLHSIPDKNPISTFVFRHITLIKRVTHHPLPPTFKYTYSFSRRITYMITSSTQRNQFRMTE